MINIKKTNHVKKTNDTPLFRKTPSSKLKKFLAKIFSIFKKREDPKKKILKIINSYEVHPSNKELYEAFKKGSIELFDLT